MSPGEPPATREPTTIGQYRIDRKLGEGGMGVVYAARDARLERDVALKMIRAAAADPQARARLWREARAAARVSHPRVCQLFEVGEDRGELFIAMELLDGESLAARIARGAMPVPEATDVALGVLEALEALHRVGIVHRDLKPSNVFLTRHGVKLLDFGLARWTDPDPSSGDVTLTQTGMVVGTPRYMAPEQWSQATVGAPADLFALGAILFEMLTGRCAFGGSSPIEIYQAIARDQPPALAGGASVVGLDRVIQRALAKRPADRYPDAASMAADLRRAAEAIDSRESVQVRAVTRFIALPLRVLRSDPETDFLAFSLPDAVTASLSGLTTLVVRSSAMAARFAAEHPDLAALAGEADVDVVLLGTLLRAGDRVRVAMQLVEAPGGTLIWSTTAEVPLGDLFQLQDDLARRIVESLSLPLSSRERQAMRGDVPRSALAYELYLRANQAARDRQQWTVARDLYRSCLDEDADYAPAWARYGRMCRVIAKYGLGDPAAHLKRAEEAFGRALEISPQLPIAHNLYTYFEVEELGRAPDAMVRLLGQARARPSDPELFAGLVLACRYAGLLDASLAAHERARRLDPAILTSVAYTHWARGEWELAYETDPDEPRFFTIYALPMVGRVDEAIAYSKRFEAGSAGEVYRSLARFLRAALEGDRATVLANFGDFKSTSFRDPEGIYLTARSLVRVNALEEAMATLEFAVSGGFYPVRAFRGDPWLDPLRGRADFEELVARAESRQRDAARRFVEAGGAELLGVGPG